MHVIRDYKELADTWKALQKWYEDHGYQVSVNYSTVVVDCTEMGDQFFYALAGPRIVQFSAFEKQIKLQDLVDKAASKRQLTQE